MEGGGGGGLFEAGRLLTFSAFRIGRLLEVGANSRLGAYSNKYGTCTFTTTLSDLGLMIFAKSSGGSFNTSIQID